MVIISSDRVTGPRSYRVELQTEEGRWCLPCQAVEPQQHRGLLRERWGGGEMYRSSPSTLPHGICTNAYQMELKIRRAQQKNVRPYGTLCCPESGYRSHYFNYLLNIQKIFFPVSPTNAAVFEAFSFLVSGQVIRYRVFRSPSCTMFGSIAIDFFPPHFHNHMYWFIFYFNGERAVFSLVSDVACDQHVQTIQGILNWRFSHPRIKKSISWAQLDIWVLTDVKAGNDPGPRPPRGGPRQGRALRLFPSCSSMTSSCLGRPLGVIEQASTRPSDLQTKLTQQLLIRLQHWQVERNRRLGMLYASLQLFVSSQKTAVTFFQRGVPRKRHFGGR